MKSLNVYNGDYIKFPYDGKTYAVEIQCDDSPLNPRTEDDGTIVNLVCWHRRYRLGDDHTFETPDDFLDDMMVRYANHITESQSYKMTISEKVTELKKNPDIVMEPLFLYDHSGLALYLGAPGAGCDHWDTSMIGWAVLEKKSFLDIGLPEDEWSQEKAEDIIQKEFSVYAQYIEGDVHGYTLYDLEDPAEPQEIDSCWGFFGTDVLTNGISDYVPGLSEAVAAENYTLGTVQTKTYTYTAKFFD